MSTNVFNLTAFQALFPEFAATDPTALASYWAMATSYIDAADSVLLSGDPLTLALNLMTAHLAKSFKSLNSGKASAPVTSATEGSVSVSMQPPPTKDGWQFWLASTPYGVQLWALLRAQAAGASGAFVGGSLDRASFRQAGGIWL